MRHDMNAEIAGRLARAHHEGRCLAATTNRWKRALWRRVEHGLLVMPYPNVFDDPGHWDALDAAEQHLHVARSLALVRPRLVFSHQTAAIAHGLLTPAPGTPIEMHATTSETSHSTSSRLLCRHYCTDHEVVHAAGLSVTSSIRTAFDCMRTSSFGRALAIGDATLRKTGLSSDELSKEFEAYRGHRGIAQARRAARHADPRSENGGESIARASMIELGFRVPELQVLVPDPLNPMRGFRFDYLWLPEGMTLSDLGRLIERDELSPRCLVGGVAGELDGVDKYLKRGKTHISRPGAIGCGVGGIGFRGDGIQDAYDPDIEATRRPNGLSADSPTLMPWFTTRREFKESAFMDERRRESRSSAYGLTFVRFFVDEAENLEYMERLLTAYGIPRD